MTESDETQRMYAAWEGRLTAIENDQATIKGTLADVQKTMSAMARSESATAQAVKSITASLDSISTNQTTNLRTNWGVIFAGLTVAAIFFGLVVYDPLNKLMDDHQQHVEDGHPTSVLDRIMADERRLEHRLDRKQQQLTEIEKRIDELANRQSSMIERMLSVERDVYIGAQYRAGRPSKIVPAPVAASP